MLSRYLEAGTAMTPPVTALTMAAKVLKPHWVWQVAVQIDRLSPQDRRFRGLVPSPRHSANGAPHCWAHVSTQLQAAAQLWLQMLKLVSHRSPKMPGSSQA